MGFIQQEDRNLYLETPLGANQLLLNHFNGHEAISELFSFHLAVLAEPSTSVAFEKLIGQQVSFGVLGGLLGMGNRDFDGIAIQVAQGARLDDFYEYEITVAPKIWKLTRTFRSRIFQHITVPDILKELFEGYDVDYQIVGTFEERNYCTQYQESDFDFASRLMEEEGIYYYFQFPDRGEHTMVIANTPQSHDDLPGDDPSVLFEPVEGGLRDDERITHWHKAQNWTSGKYTLWDHHFQLPGKNLMADQPVMSSVQVGSVAHQLNLGNADMEVYEHPGRYAYRFDGIDKAGGEQPDDLQKIFKDNKRTVGIRMDQTETPALLISGAGNHRMFTAGHKFLLLRGIVPDGKYVILSVSHDASEGSFRSGDEDDKPSYRNAFACLPFALPFRPARRRQVPRIAGPVSGVVVGPEGEEIFTDKYGRVKVQLYWDREGDFDIDSSCWMQVATPWAGQNWGSIHIPRIGQEVLVSFLEGDPDHPVVMGSVYNPDQMPPYNLPDHKTVSTLKSRSTKKGGKGNFNELRFEDLKGKEQVFFHAERDMDERVKAESREWIGANRSLLVKANQKEHVGSGKHSNVNANYVFATGGDKHIQTKGNIYEKIGGNHEWTLTGDNTDQIKGNTCVTVNGDHKENVDGKVSLTVGKSLEEKTGTKFAHEAGQEIHLKAGMKIVIEAGMELTLKVGGNFIDISAAGISIVGTLINLNSGGAPGSGSGSSPDTPATPQTEIKDPVPPDHADNGTKFDRM
jgi:type VI secretion system secreted protein VgrG